MVWWARYHVALGVDTIYLYVHDPSVVAQKGAASKDPSPLLEEVQRGLREAGLDRAVLALPALAGPPPKGGAGFVDVVAMQERDATDAIRRARAQSMAWLFHIDDDELLHLTGPEKNAAALGRAVDRARAKAFNLRIDNLECQRTFEDVPSASGRRAGIRLTRRGGRRGEVRGDESPWLRRGSPAETSRGRVFRGGRVVAAPRIRPRRRARAAGTTSSSARRASSFAWASTRTARRSRGTTTRATTSTAGTRRRARTARPRPSYPTGTASPRAASTSRA